MKAANWSNDPHIIESSEVIFQFLQTLTLQIHMDSFFFSESSPSKVPCITRLKNYFPSLHIEKGFRNRKTFLTYDTRIPITKDVSIVVWEQGRGEERLHTYLGWGKHCRIINQVQPSTERWIKKIPSEVKRWTRNLEENARTTQHEVKIIRQLPVATLPAKYLFSCKEFYDSQTFFQRCPQAWSRGRERVSEHHHCIKHYPSCVFLPVLWPPIMISMYPTGTGISLLASKESCQRTKPIREIYITMVSLWLN